jgi:carotenoid cleavage dioxygenase-like enzyme
MCGINSRRGRLYYEFLRYPQSDLEPGPRGDAGLCTNAYTVARIPSNHFTKLSYFHSFGLTENYIIFLEQSLLLYLTKFFIGLFTNRTFADALVMRPNMNTLIHLVDRSTGKQVKTRYSTCPLFLFHHINAYEIKETSPKTKCNEENDDQDEKSMTMR